VRGLKISSLYGETFFFLLAGRWVLPVGGSWMVPKGAYFLKLHVDTMKSAKERGFGSGKFHLKVSGTTSKSMHKMLKCAVRCKDLASQHRRRHTFTHTHRATITDKVPTGHNDYMFFFKNFHVRHFSDLLHHPHDDAYVIPLCGQ
jgi:hypothetical protein